MLLFVRKEYYKCILFKLKSTIQDKPNNLSIFSKACSTILSVTSVPPHTYPNFVRSIWVKSLKPLISIVFLAHSLSQPSITIRWLTFFIFTRIKQSPLLTPASQSILPIPLRASIRVRRSASSPTSEAPEQAKKALSSLLVFVTNSPTTIYSPRQPFY